MNQVMVSWMLTGNMMREQILVMQLIYVKTHLLVRMHSKNLKVNQNLGGAKFRLLNDAQMKTILLAGDNIGNDMVSSIHTRSKGPTKEFLNIQV